MPSGESATLKPTSSSVYDDGATSSSSGCQSLPQVFTVLPMPAETPRASRETGPAGSSCTNFFDRSCCKESPPCCCPQDKTPACFKPMNLPKFDPKDNVHTFICLFGMSMYVLKQSGMQRDSRIYNEDITNKLQVTCRGNFERESEGVDM
ncbi:hypothetical protein DSO57_1020377 [Entomophthora muscae]|uniref:Uncharacterized protein n=1 Tax=Entomophthora muscae TaxID=34485 RepID=A0ACC2UEI6_9FUNG|nr:hypothetical protein DSO57_1020377 [Entomophthora muscae]